MDQAGAGVARTVRSVDAGTVSWAERASSLRKADGAETTASVLS